MKTVNKILLLCLVFALFCMPALAYNSGTIDYLEALPDNVSDEAPLTREVLAYSAAKLSVRGITLSPTETAFSDVTSENSYSGYIAFVQNRGIMSGCGNGLFVPDGRVTPGQAAKVLCEVLGYGPLASYKGGTIDSYTAIAADIGMFKMISYKRQLPSPKVTLC